MPPEATFQLNGQTLLTIAALIGSLAGTVALLFRQLIAAKDAQIAGMQRELESQRAVMMGQIEALKADRDRFRDIALRDRRAVDR